MNEMREYIDAKVWSFNRSFGHMPTTIWVGRKEWEQIDCEGQRLRMFYLTEDGYFSQLVIVPTPSEHFFGVSSIPYKV